MEHFGVVLIGWSEDTLGQELIDKEGMEGLLIRFPALDHLDKDELIASRLGGQLSGWAINESGVRSLLWLDLRGIEIMLLDATSFTEDGGVKLGSLDKDSLRSRALLSCGKLVCFKSFGRNLWKIIILINI